jgi:hypothetical protein
MGGPNPDRTQANKVSEHGIKHLCLGLSDFELMKSQDDIFLSHQILPLICRKADEAFDKLSERTTIDSMIPPKLSIQYDSLRTIAPISAITTAMLINPSARWWAALEASTGDL